MDFDIFCFLHWISLKKMNSFTKKAKKNTHTQKNENKLKKTSTFGSIKRI